MFTKIVSALCLSFASIILANMSFADSPALPKPALNQGENISYTVQGKTYEGYFVGPQKIPSDGTAPLVLLVHDWDGLTDYERTRAHMLSEQGYAVFAADLFGKGVRPTKLADKRQHTGELYKNRDKLRALLNAALVEAGKSGGDVNNAVAMGYCFGGAAVLEMARSGAAMKGFASFHGGLGTPQGQNYKNTKAPILVMHGSADSLISLDQFVQLAKELETAGIENEMITYSGAPHAFTVLGSPSYQKQADQSSWRRFQDFLKERL